MTICSDNEKDITSDKLSAKFGISVITIIYFVYILFIIGLIVISLRKNKQIIPSIVPSKPVSTVSIAGVDEIDTFTKRFTEWFTKVGHAINSNSVLAILAAGVVIGFNGLIMTPLITTMFPIEINQPIQIKGKNTYINPGQFFIALIGFILSLILFFFVTEGIYLIKKYFKNSLIYAMILILFLFLTFMLIWNGMETDKVLKLPDCVPVDTNVRSFQLKINNSNNTDNVNLPTFGMFG